MAPQDLGRDQLKVDATSVLLEGGRRIAIYNFNIPSEYVDDEDRRRQVLERIDNVVRADFGSNQVQYMITASYYLRNIHTGKEYIWTGSFFLRENSPATISSFQPYNANFVANAFHSLQNVRTKLTWLGVNTAWTFDRLESAIVNVQSSVSEYDPILELRQLNRQGSRGRRHHETFLLP